MPNFFEDYASTYNELGSAEFNKRYRHPVLIGVGIVGDLEESGARGQAQTFLAALHTQDEREGSLVRRVWMINKRDYGPAVSGIRVGRDASNDIVIPDYSISKMHCEFHPFEEHIALRDLDSHNGTLVEGNKVTHLQVFLEDEDEVVLGRYKFEFLTAATFVTRVMNTASYI